MTNFTTTVSNALKLFSEHTSNWNSLVWGTDFWGSGSRDEIQAIGKLIKLSITPSNAILKGVKRSLSESITPAATATSMVMSDDAGYDYVFPDNVINIENRITTTYTNQSASAVSYASNNASSSTVWS